MSTQVMTVLGPVPAVRLGAVLPHEHLLINATREFQHPDAILSDVPLAVAETIRFRDSGGGTIVEVTSRNLGRDPLGLRQISLASGVNILVGCGWYREPYYEPEVYVKSASELAADIVRDITDGIDGTGIRAGIIGEIGNGELRGRRTISPAEERSFRAAARAQKQTGLAITTHAFLAPVGIEQLNLLKEEGVDLRVVIIGHCDSVPDPDYHEALARRGAWVQFDLLGSLHEWAIESALRLILEFRDRGYLQRLLLSHDVTVKSDLHAYGGTGYDYLLTTFAARMRAAGLSQEEIDVITVANPAAALCGQS